MIKKERKKALPPVSEALYLNCELLFKLAETMQIPDSEKNRIDAILHENGNNIFLTELLDDQFRFVKEDSDAESDEIKMEFDGDHFTIPAIYVTDRSEISAVISGDAGDIPVDDWAVSEVKRPKEDDCSSFMAKFESKTAEKYKYRDGDTITIDIIPVLETPENFYTFKYSAKTEKKAFVLNDIKFERLEE